MPFRSPTALSIVVGAALGALLAIARPRAHEQALSSTPDSASSATFRPVGRIAAESRSKQTRANLTAHPAPSASSPAATSVAESAHDAGSKPRMSEGRPKQSPSREPAPQEHPLPASHTAVSATDVDEELVSPHERPIQTPKELLKSEVRCDNREPDECIRAADAYDLGRVIAKNDDRADRHRKVGLTHYVNQCHSQDPSACFALARMYREGDIVRKDAAHAEALLDHVSRLCAYKKAAVCQTLTGRAP